MHKANCSIHNIPHTKVSILTIQALGNFSSFGFSSVGIERWQKPKVLKYAAGQYETQR